MGAIDVAVFAFDMNEAPRPREPGGRAAAWASPRRSCSGKHARELRLRSLPRRGNAATAGPSVRAGKRPLELRRSTFRRDGKPHQLLVFADLTRSLREEEQQAWQRIVRVLSHEINNSLTPIKSIAHSIKRMIDRACRDIPRAAEIQDGLNLIETRSGALGPLPARLRPARAAAEASGAERADRAAGASHRRAREPHARGDQDHRGCRGQRGSAISSSSC